MCWWEFCHCNITSSFVSHQAVLCSLLPVISCGKLSQIPMVVPLPENTNSSKSVILVCPPAIQLTAEIQMCSDIIHTTSTQLLSTQHCTSNWGDFKPSLEDTSYFLLFTTVQLIQNKKNPSRNVISTSATQLKLLFLTSESCTTVYIKFSLQLLIFCLHFRSFLSRRYLHFVIENLGLASVSCWNEVFVQYIQNVTTD